MLARATLPLCAGLCAAILISACAPAATRVGPAAGPTDAEIEAEDLRLRVEILAHDSMAGRESGTPGGAAAERYLAAELARLGLRPAGDGGSYLQRVPLTKTRTRADVTAVVQGAEMRLGPTHILPAAGLGGLPESSRTAGSGTILFAGHFIDPDVGSEEITLDELQDAVLIVRLAPPAGVDLTRASPRMPIAAALSPGSPAAAVIFVTEEAEAEFWNYAAEVLSEGILAVDNGSPSAALGNTPPSFLISTAAVERLIGVGLDAARAPRRNLGTLEYSIDKQVRPVAASNVAGILPGRDPARADEYVGLGAHFDHVGIGAAVDGDSIYNGADDNASGTVALLEIAEALAYLPPADRPARSVLFVWNAAEEAGLLGSEYFTDHPTVPREDIVAHVNMDMVGRNDPDSIFVVGSRRISTELGDLLEAVNQAQPSPFIFDYTFDAPGHPEQIYCRSDHYSYARYGIPIVFLTSGLHDDYHAPSDEAELLDYRKIERVSELLLALTMEIANRADRPAVDQVVPPLGTPCQ